MNTLPALVSLKTTFGRGLSGDSLEINLVEIRKINYIFCKNSLRVQDVAFMQLSMYQEQCWWRHSLEKDSYGLGPCEFP